MPVHSKMSQFDGRRARKAMVPAAAAGVLVATQISALTTGFVVPSTLSAGAASSDLSVRSTKADIARSVTVPSNDDATTSGAGVAAGALAAVAGAAVLRSGARRSGLTKRRQGFRTGLVDTVVESVNAVRFLAADAINVSNSGHPGAPMGQAPIGYVLYGEVMKYNPDDSKWANRDRFVLSSGHGCMLQYALMHLAGFKSVSIDDIKKFRQWGSKTPGHPENFETDGVEVTTGPLGMGISNAVGLAATEAHLAAVYNKPGLPLIDHYTYCIMGDGCLQEGISHEACSLAGHLGLGKLIAFWDDNGITIDGKTDLSFTEDVCKRYEAYGWQVIHVQNGNTDVVAIREAVRAAKAETGKPTLVRVTTSIGYGAPNKAGTAGAHGAPIGAAETALMRMNLGWDHMPFEIPECAYETYHAQADKGRLAQTEWEALFEQYKIKEPALAKQFQRSCLDKKLPDGWEAALPKYSPSEAGKATRINSHECLNALAPVLPELMGGSADLAPSNMTLMKCTGNYMKGSYGERNMRFGIREFGMGAMANAMSLHNTGMVPYCATFLIFSDYMRNAIRLAALARAGTIFVMTHDSIAVGEDGPTHQPIETIPSLRMIPDLTVMRPADGNETAGAYKYAVERSKYDSRPTLICASRQVLPPLEKSSVENTCKGAYAVVESANPQLIMVATGSEVGLCMEAAKQMSGKQIRVVSMPSWEVFRKQPDSYRSALLPKGVPTLSVEAAVTMGWGEWATAHVGINVFGASAPGNTCMDKFGFNPTNVVSCADRCLKGETGVLSDGSQGKH